MAARSCLCWPPSPEPASSRAPIPATDAMLLLQLSVRSAKILREPRQIAKSCAPVLVAPLLECKHVPEAQPVALAGFAERDAALAKKPNQILPRDIQEAGRLLDGHLLA